MIQSVLDCAVRYKFTYVRMYVRTYVWCISTVSSFLL